MRDSYRVSRTGETHWLCTEELTAHPAESEHPEAEINRCILLYSKQQSLRIEPISYLKKRSRLAEEGFINILRELLSKVDLNLG